MMLLVFFALDRQAISYGVFSSVLRIRINWFRVRIHWFRIRIRIQAFDDQKLKKTYKMKIYAKIFFCQKIQLTYP